MVFKAERKYRPDIDGLRAVAVLAVLIFHLNPEWLPGGFIGVDVFFVISGYLITKNILSDSSSAKGFSWLEFYRRRALRILPVLFFVIFCTFIYGNFVLLPQEYLDLSYSSLAAVFSGANIYFTYFLDVSYFSDDSNQKPLLHLWSLGVEEQFYMLWPLLLIFIISRVNDTYAYLIFLIIIFLSFLLAEKMLLTNPMFSYYMLPTRAGELVIGGFFSYIVLNFNSENYINGVLSNVLSSFGALLIAYSLLYLDSNTSFPGINSLFSTIGAALIIYAGASDKYIYVNKLLSFRYIVLIGLMSYSLYLWHWPVLAYYRYSFGALEGWDYFFLVTLIFTLSFLSYGYIEKKTRRIDWPFSKVMIKGVGIATVSFSSLAMLVVFTKGYGTYFYNESYKSQLSLLAPDKAAYSYKYICQKELLRASDLERKSCIINSEAEPRILLWGDSNAAHHVGVLGSIAKSEEFSFRNISHSSCPPLLENLEKNIGSKGKDNCIASVNIVQKELDNYQVIILAAAWDSYYKRNADFLTDLEKTVSALVYKNKKVIILGNIPRFKNIDKRCSQKELKMLNGYCNEAVSNYTVSNVNSLIYDLTMNYSEVSYFDVWDYICKDGYCFNSLDGQLLYFDGGHLSMSGSWKLGEYIVDKYKTPIVFIGLREESNPDY